MISIRRVSLSVIMKLHLKEEFQNKLFSKETILDFNFVEIGTDAHNLSKKYPSTTKHKKVEINLINEIAQHESSSSESNSEDIDEEDMSKFIHDALDDILDDIVYYIKRGLNEKAIALIDEHSIHPNEELTYGGSTLMHFSAEHGNVEMLKSLIKRGGSPFVVNSKGEGLIHFAAREGHSEYMKYLMKNHDMDIDQIMNDHWTPLFYACLNNHINVIEYCLETKADMNHVDKYLRTPLHWATKARSPDAVRILLDNIARYDLKDIEDKTAEQLNEKDEEIAELFVDAETKKQIRLKKQKKNLNVVRNSIKMKKLNGSAGGNSNTSSTSELPKSSRSPINDQNPKEPSVMKLKI